MLWLQVFGWLGLLIAWTWAWLVIVTHIEERAQAKQKQGADRPL